MIEAENDSKRDPERVKVFVICRAPYHVENLCHLVILFKKLVVVPKHSYKYNCQQQKPWKEFNLVISLVKVIDDYQNQGIESCYH